MHQGVVKTELGLAFGSRASATFDRYNEHAIEPQCLHSTVIRELFPTGSANGNAVIAEVHAARAAFLVGVETYGHREPDEHKPPRQRALLAGGISPISVTRKRVFREVSGSPAGRLRWQLGALVNRLPLEIGGMRACPVLTVQVAGGSHC